MVSRHSVRQARPQMRQVPARNADSGSPVRVGTARALVWASAALTGRPGSAAAKVRLRRVHEVEVAVPRGLRQAIDVPPFGKLADPRVLVGLAARAEDRGWDGFFVWDHINYRAPVRAVADPWVALAAVACATSRVRIGALVTPLSRRRVHKVARETVTLDWLSSGRLTFGAGLGSARNNELEPYGEVVDPRERANLLDQGLDALAPKV